jgi:hypothetical protein
MAISRAKPYAVARGAGLARGGEGGGCTRAAATGEDVVAAARVAAAMGGDVDVAGGGVGGATLGTGAVVDVAGVARGAYENAV